VPFVVPEQAEAGEEPVEATAPRRLWPWLAGAGAVLVVVGMGIGLAAVLEGTGTSGGGEGKETGSQKDTPALRTKLDDLIGEWDAGALKRTIDRGGKGHYDWMFSDADGASFSSVVGDLTVREKGGKFLFSMSPTVFGETNDYEFVGTLSDDKKTLEVKETRDRVKPKTLKKRPAVSPSRAGGPPPPGRTPTSRAPGS